MPKKLSHTKKHHVQILIQRVEGLRTQSIHFKKNDVVNVLKHFDIACHIPINKRKNFKGVRFLVFCFLFIFLMHFWHVQVQTKSFFAM